MTEAVARKVVVIFEGPEASRDSHLSPLISDGPRSFYLFPLVELNPSLLGFECTDSRTGNLEDADDDGLPVDAVATYECHGAELSSILQWTLQDKDDSDANAGGTFFGVSALAVGDGRFNQTEWFRYSADNNRKIESRHVSSLYDRSDLILYVVWESTETVQPTNSDDARAIFSINEGSTMYYIDGTGAYRLNVSSDALHAWLASACPSHFERGELQFEGSSGNRLVFDYTCSAVTITYNGKSL